MNQPCLKLLNLDLILQFSLTPDCISPSVFATLPSTQGRTSARPCLRGDRILKSQPAGRGKNGVIKNQLFQ